MTINGVQTNLNVRHRTDEAGAWAAFRALLDAAKHPGATIRPEPISQLVSEWLDSISHRIAPKTHSGYAILLRRLVSCHGNVPAGQLDAATVEKSARPDWSDSHKSNYLFVCQAFLRWCGHEKLKLNRPAKESRGADAVITPELHAKVLRELYGDFGQFVRLLWATGARPMEAAGLTVEIVDWATGTATLRRHKMKHRGRARILYFSSEALAILSQQRERYGKGYLFRAWYDRPFTASAVGGRFRRVSDKIGHVVTAYQYRHSYCTRALEKGIADTQVAALMGHYSTDMIHRHYAHIHANGRLLREVAERAAG